MADDIRQAALDYHRLPRPGKLAIVATKPLANQHDLALAYTPGVAAACQAIVADPGAAADYTARGNLVGVVTNGTAVLGLGAIGPLAGKPVMEGKAVLVKPFAGIVGVVYEGRTELMDPRKARYAKATKARRLADIMAGADVFLGLSAPGVLKPEMVAAMAERPLIMALANPLPEILPEEVRAVRS